MVVDYGLWSIVLECLKSGYLCRCGLKAALLSHFLTFSLFHCLYSAPWWDLRFTDGDNGTYDTAIENMLESYILGASSMVYLANYSIPSANTKITTSMNNRDSAGLDIKYVGDGGEGNYTGLQSGIPYTLDPAGSPIMHNKFLVIDPDGAKKRLVTGSGNYTAGGWGTQDNAWLMITDSNIINKYLAEFNEMFSGTFHNTSPTTNPITTANGITVHTLFSSEDGPWLVGNIVDTKIRAATESVFFETTGHDPTNSGTLDIDEAIWSVLDDAGKPNFFCEGVVNSMGGNQPTFSGTALTNYNNKGGYIRQSAVTSYDKHHLKYVVVDMDWLGVGSVNASKASSEYTGSSGNDENHIFINDFRLARAFMREFSRHYKLDTTIGSVDNSSVTAPHDWTAPAAPTALGVASHTSSFTVTWTAPADPGDFSRYYIFISTNNTIATAKNEITEAADGSFRASILRPETQKKGLTTTSATLSTYNEGDALLQATNYYIGVVSVDKYGNESAALTGGPYKLGTNLAPNNPSSMGQYKSDGTTAIAEGGTIQETTVIFKATISDPDGGNVKLQVEVKPFATAFDGTGLDESAFLASGSVASITKTALTKTDYHWRAVAVDTNTSTSNWLEFGTAGNIDFTISNTAPTAPTVTVPNGGEKWKALSTTHTITWTAASDANGDTLTYQIDYSIDNGTGWKGVASGVSGTSFNWTVPATPSAKCLVRIRAYDGSVYGPYDQSNAVFTIWSDAPPATDHLVISQVRISTISSANTDFVELYNPTNSSINLSTKFYLHRYNTTPTDKNLPLNFVNNTIPAKGFFLLANTSYTGGDLPAGGADATYTASNVILSNYCVYLSTTDTTYAALPSIKIDAVGLGTNPQYETKATTSPAAGKTVERKPGSPDGNGTDTDNNSADFMYPVTSHPRNSSTPSEPPVTPNTAPGISTVTAPNGGENWGTGTSKNITWIAANDAEGDPLTYQIDYSIDNGANWTSVTASTTGTVYNWSVPNTPSTQCLLRIRAFDGSLYGNYDQSNAVWTITGVLNNPPTAPTNGSPEDPFNWTNDNTPQFTWTFNDPDVSNDPYTSDSQSAYRWQADDDPGFESVNYDSGKRNTPSSSHIPSSALADGIWYWHVMTWDKYGSSGPYSASYTLKLDATPPTTILDLAASVSGSNVVLTWTAATDATSGVKNYRIYRAEVPISDDNKWSAVSFADDATPGFTDTTANTGTIYYYVVTTLDNAGNESSVSNNVQITTSGNAVRRVVINELAITGTNASSTDEWMELFNPSEGDIDLTGWKIILVPGTEISLSTTPVIIIPAGGYVLWERTNDNNVKGPDYIAAKISTGAISDNGADVTLKDQNGNVVDSVLFKGGWPVTLSSTTDQTLERKDASVSGSEPTNWALNDMITKNGIDAADNPINGTPKKLNSAYQIQLLNCSVTPTTGTVTQSYTYSVLYKNSANIAPNIKQVIIDTGTLVGDMTGLEFANYNVSGRTYTFTTSTPFPPGVGVHNYYFYFTAGSYTRSAPSKAPDEVFTGPWVGADLEKISMYGSGATNPNPTTNPEDNTLTVQLPKSGKYALYAYLSPGSLGWKDYYSATFYWSTSTAAGGQPLNRSRKMTGVTDGNIDKFYVELTSGTDFLAGRYINYYVRAGDKKTNPKFTDDAGDTNADRWVSAGDTNPNTVNSYHYFKFGTESSGAGTFEYKMVKREESSADFTGNNGWDWVVVWRASASVENVSGNKSYNSEDIGIGVSISPGGTNASCTFYYRTDGSTPTTADWCFSSVNTTNFNKNTVNSISDFKLFLPSELNSAGTTIQVLAVVKDDSGVVYNSPTYIFKYMVAATPGTPAGDKDDYIVRGRGNRNGQYPTTDFDNYSPLRYSHNETMPSGSRYLSPGTTDFLTIDANFLTQPARDPSVDGTLTPQYDGVTDVFYSDPVKFYLRTAYNDSADSGGLGIFSEASLVWRTVGSVNWSEELMQVKSAGNDNQNPHYLKYHWLATTDNTAVQGNPPDCTKGAPEGSTVNYIFKIRDTEPANGDFIWLYRGSDGKQRIDTTDAGTYAKSSGNQFSYRVMQDDHTRPVAYLPRIIPAGTITDFGFVPSTFNAPSWPSPPLGSTSIICGSTVETVKIYVGLFDTANGRFTDSAFGSTACIVNSNYIHRTFKSPPATLDNTLYWGNDVLAINTSTNSANSGIKGGRTADSYAEGLEKYNSEGRRVTHDVMCYYVWRRSGAHTGATVDPFSWIDIDGTINDSPDTDSTGTNLADSTNQMIRIANVDGETDDYYVTQQSSAATKGWISDRVSMAPYNVDADGNGIWVAEIPAPSDMDLQIATSAVSFLYYRIWACNGDNDPQTYNTEIHGGSLMSGGLPSSPAQCQPHEETTAKFGKQSLAPYGKTYVNVGKDNPCVCGRIHDRDYGWVDITRYGGKISSPPRVMIKSKVTIGGVSRTITTYLKVDLTTKRPTNIISTQVGAE